MDAEVHVEAYLVKRVKEEGGLCLKFLSPSVVGVPDRICILPGGNIFFVELKRPKGGRLSERQKIVISQLRRLRARVYFLSNRHEIDAMMREELGE